MCYYNYIKSLYADYRGMYLFLLMQTVFYIIICEYTTKKRDKKHNDNFRFVPDIISGQTARSAPFLYNFYESEEIKMKKINERGCLCE